jgi:hypothetical protein
MVALAPVAGAANVTEAPLIATLAASVTFATSGFANALLVVALCPLPEETTILAGVWTTVGESVLDTAAVPELVCVRSPPP